MIPFGIVVSHPTEVQREDPVEEVQLKESSVQTEVDPAPSAPSVDFKPIYERLNRLEVSSLVQLAQMSQLSTIHDVRALDSKVTLTSDSFHSLLSSVSANLERKYEEQTSVLERRMEELNQERMKIVVEEMSSVLMTKMTDHLHYAFASQFAPLSDEVSMTKNVLRGM